MLTSDKSSVECKKILCKEFSWAANDSYKTIYEELKEAPELKDEAQYALDLMNPGE